MYVFGSNFIVYVKDCPLTCLGSDEEGSVLEKNFYKVRTFSVNFFLVSYVVNTALLLTQLYLTCYCLSFKSTACGTQ